MEQKFFICKHCGNLVGAINFSGVPMICCGEKMQEIVPNSVEAATEKHIPAVTLEGDMLHVVVGSVEHPMLPEHYIQWIFVKTEHGGQRRALNPGDKPQADFCVASDKPVAVYAYCNIHGLWVKEL